jgi:hypothetical protein
LRGFFWEDCGEKVLGKENTRFFSGGFLKCGLLEKVTLIILAKWF